MLDQCPLADGHSLSHPTLEGRMIASKGVGWTIPSQKKRSDGHCPSAGELIYHSLSFKGNAYHKWQKWGSGTPLWFAGNAAQCRGQLKKKNYVFMMFSLKLKFGHNNPKVQQNRSSKTLLLFFSLFFHLSESWALGIISIWQWMNLTDFILLLNNYVDQRNLKKPGFC